MKYNVRVIMLKLWLIAFFGVFSFAANGQSTDDFWSRVRFGGSLGVAFGSGYTDVTLAPAALYEVNQYVGVGLGIQGSYVNQRNLFNSFMYGGSVITVLNPIPEIQFSAELEQLRVNLEVEDSMLYEAYTHDFWNTALFLGAGYRMDNVTIGLRYNVLFNEDDFVYSNAFMPFIRVFF